GVISGFNSGRAVGMGQTTSGYPGFGISSGATSLAAFYHDPFTNETVVEAYGARNIRFSTNGATRMTVNSSGNVGIGPQLTIWTDTNAHIDGNGKSIFFQGINASIDSSGNIYGKTKNFRIDDPLDPEHRYLIHTSLEGPEAAVYYRGEGQLKNSRVEITLPVYFEALTRKDGRTVLLTNIDGGDVLWIETQDGTQIRGGKFIVRSSNPDSSQKFNWEAKAVRADIEPLKAEVSK
ncbi:MAG: hypothetical protein KGJ13_12950, partial [Patescibacteria group bacterium]|nr:hypothetical protein [Patescibacteria group bacterium]